MALMSIAHRNAYWLRSQASSCFAAQPEDTMDTMDTIDTMDTMDTMNTMDTMDNMDKMDTTELM